MSHTPLLSLCIPTYNLSQSLRYVLEKFVENAEFNDEVELVISDNCSTDNTRQVGEEYAGKYSNIKYFRNEENIRDKNFIKVLDRGTGKYLKLLNDWCYITDSSLRFMKQCVLDNLKEHSLFFFTYDRIFTDRKQLVTHCTSVDDYMQVISSYVTSNNVFGVWKDDWTKIVDKEKYSALQLMQLDWSYQLVKMYNGQCTLYDHPVLSFAPDTRKHEGYHWFKVHIDNYYTILEPYVKEGLISPETLKQDKRYVLQHFTPELRKTFHLSARRGWNFETKGTWNILMKHYGKDWYFYFYMFTLPIQKFIQRRKHRW